jgi:hypothetical protein
MDSYNCSSPAFDYSVLDCNIFLPFFGEHFGLQSGVGLGFGSGEPAFPDFEEEGGI